LSLYFLRHNIKVSTARSAAEVHDLKRWIEATGDQIAAERRWQPCPGQWCAHCDFRTYCPAVSEDPQPVPASAVHPPTPQQSLLPLVGSGEEGTGSQLSLEMGD
jgi:putative RecB family exonuclease